MSSNLSVKNLFQYYLFNPRSDDLSSKDKKIATAVTILLGLCTAGVAHLFFRVFLYKDLSEKRKAQSAQTDQVFRQTIPVKESIPIGETLPGAPHLEPLHLFFRGEGTDCEGRTLEEIISWDDRRKESQHDYIQWLFPTYQRSAFNQNAPQLHRDLVAAMKRDPKVLANMRRAFVSMLTFYGLHYDPVTKKVERTVDFGRKAASWCTPRNHNMLRITRILASLKTFGLQDEVKAFFDALKEIQRDYNISENTYRFWVGAAKK